MADPWLTKGYIGRATAGGGPRVRSAKIFEILHGSGEKELIACAGKTPQPVLSFQLDLPLPMSRTDRGIRPMEEVHVREKFPRYMDTVPGTGVLLQLEDGLRP